MIPSSQQRSRNARQPAKPNAIHFARTAHASPQRGRATPRDAPLPPTHVVELRVGGLNAQEVAPRARVVQRLVVVARQLPHRQRHAEAHSLAVRRADGLQGGRGRGRGGAGQGVRGGLLDGCEGRRRGASAGGNGGVTSGVRPPAYSSPAQEANRSRCAPHFCHQTPPRAVPPLGQGPAARCRAPRWRPCTPPRRAAGTRAASGWAAPRSAASACPSGW